MLVDLLNKTFRVKSIFGHNSFLKQLYSAPFLKKPFFGKKIVQSISKKYKSMNM